MDIWRKAFERLDEKEKEFFRDRGFLDAHGGHVDIRSSVELCKEKGRQCADKRWTVTLRGRTIELYQITDRIINWLEKFKTIGDVAVNSDPLHAGLPWAGVRTLLQVSPG